MASESNDARHQPRSARSFARAIVAPAVALALLLGGPVASGVFITRAHAETSLPTGLETADDADFGMAGFGLVDSFEEWPQVLSDADAERYARIFALQSDGRFDEADRLIARLGDRLLMGHVTEQRLMHPTAYTASYDELRDWMAFYGDHPDAERIYALAMKRRPGGEARPREPERPEETAMPVASRQPSTIDQLDSYSAADRLKGAQAKRARALEAQIAARIRKGEAEAAEKLIGSAEVQKLFDRPALDQARIRVASLHLMQGQIARAYELAGPAADRSAAIVPYGHWTAGLAAWKLGRVETARRHFELFARTAGLSAWNEAAGAFWAARTNMALGDFDTAQTWLDRAARQPLTFYGQIARAMLGAPTGDVWQPSLAGGVTPGLRRALLQNEGARRALALAQIGEYDRAAGEVELVAAAAAPEEAPAVVELAEQVNAPEAATVIGRKVAAASGMPDVASIFPVPDYTPRGGFSVDRALLYALARKESNFNPHAVSPAGARGLMQLMPGTAQLVANSLGLGGGLSLSRPDVNLQLGQAYLRRLMDEPYIGNNLVNVLVAYNAGPGNLRRWQDGRGISADDDPLFFVETIPVAETRDFLEQVLTNLWIYRNRLGQTSPSLAALAEGDWPSYETIDGNVGSDNAAIASRR